MGALFAPLAPPGFCLLGFAFPRTKRAGGKVSQQELSI